MNRFYVIVAAAVCVLILQTTAVEILLPAWLRPDLMLGVALWAGLRLDTRGALCAAFLLGSAMGLYSGAPAGLLSVGYMLTAAGCSHAESSLRVDPLISASVLATLGSVCIGAMVLVAQWVHQSGAMDSTVMAHVPVKAVMTGAAAALTASIMDRVAS